MATLVSCYITTTKLQELLNLAQGQKGVAFTAALNDEANAYNQNASFYVSQTKEQREAKETKKYFANGSIVWTDGKVTLAPKKDAQPTLSANDVEIKRQLEKYDPAEDVPF